MFFTVTLEKCCKKAGLLGQHQSYCTQPHKQPCNNVQEPVLGASLTPSACGMFPYVLFHSWIDTISHLHPTLLWGSFFHFLFYFIFFSSSSFSFSFSSLVFSDFHLSVCLYIFVSFVFGRVLLLRPVWNLLYTLDWSQTCDHPYLILQVLRISPPWLTLFFKENV